ncbi:putative pantothenate kinase [Helianthus annuus]|nr:putative pantothenate kinase [Helianthus annuus]KAJ0867204.1 putative pantothenate kinase [Helianthus annuus]
MLPLARELLRRGTEHCDILRGAAEAGGLLMDAMSNTQDNPSEKLSSTPLMVVENVCGRPCIDLRQVSSELAAVAKDADLVILEGMGRALHTNYNARFKCDALKVNTCSCHHWF